MKDKMIINIPDINGNESPYEILHIEELNNNRYIVVIAEDPKETEVIILKEELIEGSDNAKYSPVTDENIINEVFKKFKENTKDHINFLEKKDSINEGEVVEFNNKEYICFQKIEYNNTKYVYFISNSKPVEIKFAKELEYDKNGNIEIINDPKEKDIALALLQNVKKDD